ncbi:hypothetical protein ACF061_36560 [Streptomyces sp. NPDC015220]|uniref:hypothetical protein n=1 Tax=Streptomyces sp. NPDC015220 TaxID=3364947 RepID=UPI0036FA0F63
MPLPPLPRALPGPRRRSLLASAAGAALLVGCSAGTDGSAASDGGPSPAERARAQAARDSAELIRRYDAVIAAHPALAGRLRPLRTEVAHHVAAFGGDGAAASPAPTPSTASGAATTAPPAAPLTSPAATDGAGLAAGARESDGPSASAPAVPEKPKDALARLATAERSLADRRAAALLDVPGELARLLASVAAAGAAHVYLLTEGGK